MSEPQKIEGCWFLLVVLASILVRPVPKSNTCRLAGFYLQVECRQPLCHLYQVSSGVLFIFEACNVIISVTHEMRSPFATPLEAFLKPEIQDIMQVYVRKYWRNQTALWRTFLTCLHYSVFHYPCLEESPDGPQEVR